MSRVPGFCLAPLSRGQLQRQHATITSRKARRYPAKWKASASSLKPAENVVGSFRLAPSDFAYLWNECKRCFYLKAHKKLYRPRAPFPSIFGTIDLGMKRHFRGLNTTALLPEMKSGTFLCEDNDAWVECKPFTPPGHTHSVFIRGMVDALVRFDDKSYGIIDFKTSQAAKASETYSRQLHAYARALEDPSTNSELEGGTVSDMGLVVYTPGEFHTPTTEEGAVKAALTGDLTYVPVERDDKGFERFLGEVVDVLALPGPPAPPPPSRARWGGGSFSSCPYCQFLHEAGEKGLIHGRG